MLVTMDEVKNAIGKDLQEALGVTVDRANMWIEDQEEDILNFIADYAWGGMGQVKRYLSDPNKREIIKKAVIRQICFLADNNFIDKGAIAEKSKADNLIDIAPKAYEILKNNGLLRIGR